MAGVWGSGLIVAGFVVPRYRTTSESTTGEVTYGSDTLVGVNGPGVVVVLAVPFVVTVLVGCALLLRAHRGALLAAWTLTVMLAMFTLLAMMSIGFFVVPVTAALIVACATSRPQPPRHGQLPRQAPSEVRTHCADERGTRLCPCDGRERLAFDAGG
jgi:hypothetical protein